MKNTGDGRRVAKVEKEVQSLVATFLIRGFRFPLPALVTVSRVQMPADLRLARVFVSIYGTAEQKSEAIKTLNGNKRDVQAYLGKHLGLRYTPVLEFFNDEGTEHMMKINQLLKDIKAGEEPGSSSQGEE